MIKLIASDIDGTLLGNHEQVMKPRIAELIKILSDHDIYFVAASGRQYANLQKLFGPLSDRIGYIAENGSLCIFQDRIISQSSMDRESARRVIQAIHDFPGCHAMVSGVNVCYIDSHDPRILQFIQDEMNYNVIVVDDFLTEIKEPILKIAAFDLNGGERIAAHFPPMFQGDIKAVTAGKIWVDFGMSSINKGVALQSLLDYLHIDPKDCVTFGDQHNDREMLMLAGNSYAMTSGAPGIAAYAKHTTDSVEQILEKIAAGL